MLFFSPSWATLLGRRRSGAGSAHTGCLLLAHPLRRQLPGSGELGSAHAVRLFLQRGERAVSDTSRRGRGVRELGRSGRRGGRTMAACFFRLASRAFSRWLPRDIVGGERERERESSGAGRASVACKSVRGSEVRVRLAPGGLRRVAGAEAEKEGRRRECVLVVGF